MDIIMEHDLFNKLEHQPCVTALETSALSGCEMCSMFLEGVALDYCKAKKVSRNEALQIFRGLESEGPVRPPCSIYFENGYSLSNYLGYKTPFMETLFLLRNCRGKPSFQ